MIPFICISGKQRAPQFAEPNVYNMLSIPAPQMTVQSVYLFSSNGEWLKSDGYIECGVRLRFV